MNNENIEPLAPQPGVEAAPATEAVAPKVYCANCGAELLGQTCYACGQPVKGMVRHLASIMADRAYRRIPHRTGDESGGGWPISLYGSYNPALTRCPHECRDHGHGYLDLRPSHQSRIPRRAEPPAERLIVQTPSIMVV